jgi:hypothetical protein
MEPRRHEYAGTELSLVEQLYPAGSELVEAVGAQIRVPVGGEPPGVYAPGVPPARSADLFGGSEQLDPSVGLAPRLIGVVDGDRRRSGRPQIAGVAGAWFRQPDMERSGAQAKYAVLTCAPQRGVTVAIAQSLEASRRRRASLAMRDAQTGSVDRAIGTRSPLPCSVLAAAGRGNRDDQLRHCSAVASAAGAGTGGGNS